MRGRSGAPSLQLLPKYFSAPGSWTDWRHSLVPVVLSINPQILSDYHSPWAGDFLGKQDVEEALWLISLMTRISISSLLKPLFLRNSRRSCLMSSKTWFIVSGICSHREGPCLFLFNVPVLLHLAPVSQRSALTARTHPSPHPPRAPASLAVLRGAFQIKFTLCRGVQKWILSHCVFK